MSFDIPTIVAERAAVLAHARKVCAAIDVMESRGALDGADVTLLKRTLLNFANDIAIGFHIEGEPPAELRQHMRAAMGGRP